MINNEVPLLKNSDPLRIILHTSKFGLSGIEVDKKFIKKRIIGELAEPGTLTFCLGFSSHKGLGKRFVRIWNEILTSSFGQTKILFYLKDHHLVSFLSHTSHVLILGDRILRR